MILGRHAARITFPRYRTFAITAIGVSPEKALRNFRRSVRRQADRTSSEPWDGEAVGCIMTLSNSRGGDDRRTDRRPARAAALDQGQGRRFLETGRLRRVQRRPENRPHLGAGVPPDEPLMWTITGAIVKPSHGFAATCDEAKAKFAETWRKWLAR